MDQFWWKNGPKRKIAIFWYFAKMEITQVQIDQESWNLAKSWRIILSKIPSQHFLIIWVLMKNLKLSSKICPNILRYCQIFEENINFSKITQIIKKSCDWILDNIILHNLATFQLCRSFYTWVISIFVKYQKIAFLLFWTFFHIKWSKVTKLQ